MIVRDKLRRHRLLIYIAIALVAYLLGPRVIPALGRDGSIDLTLTAALAWWCSTLVMMIFISLALRQAFKWLRETLWRSRTKKSKP